MKKILIAVAFFATYSIAFSQEDKKEDKDLMTWYHKDFKTCLLYTSRCV